MSDRKEPLASASRRKRERKKKHALKATKKLFEHLSKHLMDRRNKLNNEHLWILMSILPPEPPTPPKLEEADLVKTLDWMIAPVEHCLGCYTTKCKFRPWLTRLIYKDDNFFQQYWFLGMYKNQLMTRHCPEWADKEPIVQGTLLLWTSAAGPNIQLAQSCWESPSTIGSKATWDSQSHENPRFGLEKILFQSSNAKSSSSDDTSWNNLPSAPMLCNYNNRPTWICGRSCGYSREEETEEEHN
eukprot:jgi/Psemu1/18167/gm1.18167_g